MLHLFAGMDILNLVLAIIAALTALVVGYSAVRYVRLPAETPIEYAADKQKIFFSNAKDEINFEDDDSIYAFYGAGPKAGSKLRGGR